MTNSTEIQNMIEGAGGKVTGGAALPDGHARRTGPDRCGSFSATGHLIGAKHEEEKARDDVGADRREWFSVLSRSQLTLCINKVQCKGPWGASGKRLSIRSPGWVLRAHPTCSKLITDVA